MEKISLTEVYGVETYNEGKERTLKIGDCQIMYSIEERKPILEIIGTNGSTGDRITESDAIKEATQYIREVIMPSL